MCWQGPCLLPRSSCSPEQQGPCQGMGRAVFLAPHGAVMWPRCRGRGGPGASCPAPGRRLAPGTCLWLCFASSLST